MKIYHYTSIESLALILKNKTIRFSRLDQVDDVDEAAYCSGTDNMLLGQSAFVSCWTKEEKENLALWNMYTNYKGVRIGIDEDMFVTYPICMSNSKSFFKSLMTFENDCYISNINNVVKLYDVKYVSSPEKYIKDLVRNENGMIDIKTGDIAIYKKEEWSIQKESRFRLIISPVNPKYIEKIKQEQLGAFEIMDLVLAASYLSLKENYKFSIVYKDIPLKKEVLDNIEIMLGPNTSEGEKTIVEALLKDFPNHTIKDSYFKGKIRKKI